MKVIIAILLLLPSCTYTISMVHTSGIAEDVIDETSSSSPELSVPIV